MNDEQSSKLSINDQFNALKEKAKIMGINPGNMGIDALRKRINDQLEGKPVQDNSIESEPSTKEMSSVQVMKHLRDNYLKLIRCRIYNNNPAKRDLQGELICVGNKYLGIQRKFVPFGEMTENGYHIPYIIFNELKSRKYQQISTKRGRDGQVEVARKMAPEYTLEVMPQLTKAELKELAVSQAAAERVGV